MSPRSAPTRSASQPRVSPSGMKQMSWLSGLCATVSPRASASARTSAFDGVSPSGNRVCASCVGREHPEHVGLVLRVVARAVQLERAGCALPQDRVVTGADGVESEVERLLEHGGELDPLVAAHAGIRGAAGAVLGDEVLDHVVAEPLGEVPHVERDAEAVGGAAGVHRVLDRAAAAAAGAQRAAGAREREMHPDDVVSGVDRARGGHRGVHSPAHRRQNTHGAVYEGLPQPEPGSARRDARTSRRRRARSYAAGSAAITASTSASVVVRPSVSRKALRAASSPSPIARTTCDGSGTPAWHAEPVETAIPAASSSRRSESP